MKCIDCKLWEKELFTDGYLKIGKCPLIIVDYPDYPKYKIFTSEITKCKFTWLKRITYYVFTFRWFQR